jgi:DNA-binding beta-propeller fold protein YncE
MKYISLVFIGLVAISGCGGDNKTEAPIVTPPVTVPPTTVTPPEAKADYIGFESAPVRPIAMTHDNSTLLVTNISNNRLEVFSINNQGDASFEHSIDVGLEPVAVAISNNQAWVVNHLSDSISIIDMQSSPMRVVRTLLVGDEPRDIVFAKGKAFITTAHRGQQRMNPKLANTEGAGDSKLHTPSIERADIWVFEQDQLGSSLGGKPTKIISLFGDTFRGLALSQDNSTLYAGVMNSGNQTTAVHESVMCYGFEDDEYGAYPCQVLDTISSPNGLKDGYLPGGRTAPGVNANGDYQPWTSMIVKYDEDSGQWQDTKGRNFSNGIRFNLPDLDVFAIDTETLIQKDSYAHVGTTLFNLVVNPKSGDVYVSNTEANNATRFEGPGDFTGSTVQGNIAKSRITVISPVDKKVKPRHLNRHIDYSNLKGNGDNKRASLSTPTQLAISQDGETLYNAVIGSNKVAILPTNQLANDSYWDNDGEEFDPIKLSGGYISVEGGPSGLLLAEETKSLYVYTRFDNALVRIDLAKNEEKQRLAMPTTEPESFIAGRSMLYDANRSSSNGESSCASCHIYGDTDHLSWNLGNPDAPNGVNPQPFPTENISELGCVLIGPEDESCQQLEIINGDGDKRTIASMKGPMGTQTMRGMQNHGHMHWRGDRSVGYFGNDTEQALDEKTSFKNFIVAFEGLLGLDIELPATVEASNKSEKVVALEEDIDKFADFMLRVALPPNPIRQLDNNLSASAQTGSNFFHGERRSDGLAEDTAINGDSPDGVNCAGCHGVDPAKGFYGSRGEVAHGGEIQILKVPQLRNLYTRVGMFGLPDREGFLPSHTKTHQGDQIRGFGFLHDGATDQLVNFLRGGVFDNGETDCPEGADERHGCQFNLGKVGIPDEETRHGLVDYLMEFDNDLAPIVGQQITLNGDSPESVEQRISLFEQRAKTPFVSKLLGGAVQECDLIATGVVGDKTRGYFYDIKEGLFRSDAASEALLSQVDLMTLARQSNNTLTFTCGVPGKGWQSALDFNLNGILNADEEK